MAEIVHPRLRSALASTSSSRVNMPGGSFVLTTRTSTASREPHPVWWNSPRREEPGVGNFSEQVWGDSASVYNVTVMHAFAGLERADHLGEVVLALEGTFIGVRGQSLAHRRTGWSDTFGS